jgi:hypothetical protein
MICFCSMHHLSALDPHDITVSGFFVDWISLRLVFTFLSKLVDYVDDRVLFLSVHVCRTSRFSLSIDSA